MAKPQYPVRPDFIRFPEIHSGSIPVCLKVVVFQIFFASIENRYKNYLLKLSISLCFGKSNRSQSVLNSVCIYLLQAICV